MLQLFVGLFTAKGDLGCLTTITQEVSTMPTGCHGPSYWPELFYSSSYNSTCLGEDSWCTASSVKKELCLCLYVLYNASRSWSNAEGPSSCQNTNSRANNEEAACCSWKGSSASWVLWTPHLKQQTLIGFSGVCFTLQYWHILLVSSWQINSIPWCRVNHIFHIGRQNPYMLKHCKGLTNGGEIIFENKI